MTDPIQQQLIAARKNQILDAAAIVFAEKGFHPTTIRDIAKQAGIADGTIYNYFQSKPALLMGIFERMRETIIQENMPPAPDELDFRTFVRLFIAQPLTGLKRDNFALFRIINSEMMVNEELRTLYYKEILEPTLMMAEAYLIKHGMNPTQVHLTTRVISSLIMGLMLQIIMGDTTLTEHWDELPDFITDLLLKGITIT
jgi:AcrR family transcriptional regulator